MMTRRGLAVLTLGALLAGCGPGPDGEPMPRTVEYVDLERYGGRWYELAKIPNRFQSHCARDAMAEYRVSGEGTVRVTNSCTTAQGKRDSAEGSARVVDPASNAKLEVSFVQLFGLWLFRGDYWILELDPQYRHAVIGTPDRKYGWVLARERRLPEADWDRINTALRAQGYRPEAFVTSPQILR